MEIPTGAEDWIRRRDRLRRRCKRSFSRRGLSMLSSSGSRARSIHFATNQRHGPNSKPATNASSTVRML